MTMLPLIRRGINGWERLTSGSFAAGEAVYTPVEWDNAAWLERQRAAERARRAHERAQRFEEAA